MPTLSKRESTTQASASPGQRLTAIDRRSGLSRQEFIRQYRNPMLPVILTDAFKDWPAVSKFNFDFFRNQLGDRELTIRGKKYKLGEFVDLLLISTRENPAPYPCKLNLRAEFADLVPDIAPRYGYANPDRVGSPIVMKRFLTGLNDLEVFLGGPGGEFPYLHYDYLGLFAYINQICGEKEFTIYSPDQEAYLYVNQEMGWTSTIENHHQPDLQKYPLLAKTQPIKAVLQPGETLFIPSGWWHTARSLTPTISVAFDQLCSANWGFFKRDCCRQRRDRPHKRFMTWAFLTLGGMVLSTKEWLKGQR